MSYVCKGIGSVPDCNDKRRCFAKSLSDDKYVCNILIETYDSSGLCPFYKPSKEQKLVVKRKGKA